jgi:glycosyltransferase involved in cell wall biosynthesis
MRITFIIDHFSYALGGTEIQVEKLIQGLSAEFEIELISFRPSEWLATRGRNLGCRVSVYQINNFRRFYTYRNFFRLVRHLRKTKPDVVHTFFPVANIFGVLAARLAGVQKIVASRRDYGEWMSRRYLLMSRFANRFVARIVTNSNQVKRLTQQVEKYPENKIVVIYNGIDMGSFHRSTPNIKLRHALQIQNGNKVVGLIANYRPMKRHETFVRAAREVIQQRNDIDFLLVGQNAVPGEPKQAIQQLVTSLGIERRVHFAHADGNVRDFLSILDVGVNCSEGEGLSNAIMEYMASEIPCVVSSSGGNPDLITDGDNGYTFSLGDHHALAQKIIHIVDDESARLLFTKNAKEKIRNEMSLETMIAHFSHLYWTLGEKLC